MGFTVGARDPERSEEDAVIQFWRENRTQPGVYYKLSPDIRISDAECTRIIEDDNRLFRCNLEDLSQRVIVQPGDILGLDLPPETAGDTKSGLTFAQSSRGPTNYVFEETTLLSSCTL